jgi:mannitol-1-/sugar-/sorbitol-6-phosphatase
VVINCKAILFDLDGVLVDSTPAVARVWTNWARAHGLDTEKVIEHAHGRRSIETIRAVAPGLDAEQENARVEQMEIEDRDGVVAFPGADELLRALPEARFAIVTSATRALAKARLSYARLPVPPNLVTADDVVNGKPFPEPYLKGAELLGFAPQDCVVIEDAPAGIVAAQKAGMRVIALPNTYRIEELSGAIALIKSLKAIKLRSVGSELRIHLI